MFRNVTAPLLTGTSGACLRTVLLTANVERPPPSPTALHVVGAICTPRPSLCSTASSLCTSQRFYIHTSRVALDDTPSQAAPSTGASANESALDVAMRVNKLKKTHQTGGAGSNKAEVEQEAWQALNSLTEDQINNAEGKAVSLLLNSWAYFAKFWAKGKDGPL